MVRRPAKSTILPITALFRSEEITRFILTLLSNLFSFSFIGNDKEFITCLRWLVQAKNFNRTRWPGTSRWLSCIIIYSVKRGGMQVNC